ncbi:hypothetical protein Catovirus_2_6 [Catovirus CTV1]|uniref:FNIP repeat protein n=1 Tax=Catovirus CTV1 TaxID=1977631 RepID=A0A1V0SBF9_9VIRU|nr:hypothetical protein Catovirus_2_6 [Catovirus CTV1]
MTSICHPDLISIIINYLSIDDILTLFNILKSMPDIENVNTILINRDVSYDKIRNMDEYLYPCIVSLTDVNEISKNRLKKLSNLKKLELKLSKKFPLKKLPNTIESLKVDIRCVNFKFETEFPENLKHFSSYDKFTHNLPLSLESLECNYYYVDKVLSNYTKLKELTLKNYNYCQIIPSSVLKLKLIESYNRKHCTKDHFPQNLISLEINCDYKSNLISYFPLSLEHLSLNEDEKIGFNNNVQDIDLSKFINLKTLKIFLKSFKNIIIPENVTEFQINDIFSLANLPDKTETIINSQYNVKITKLSFFPWCLPAIKDFFS